MIWIICEQTESYILLVLLRHVLISYPPPNPHPKKKNTTNWWCAHVCIHVSSTVIILPSMFYDIGDSTLFFQPRFFRCQIAACAATLVDFNVLKVTWIASNTCTSTEPQDLELMFWSYCKLIDLLEQFEWLSDCCYWLTRGSCLSWYIHIIYICHVITFWNSTLNILYPCLKEW